MVLKRSLSRQVIDNLGLSIVRGDFKAGDALPNEADLSAGLGVSRTVTREAIKVLSEKGLVEARPKVGTLVLPRTRWNQLDADILNWEYEAGPRDQFLLKLTEVRRIIEPAAARLAAERATEAEIAAIERDYQAMALCVDDIDQYISVDIRFHAHIVQASHNELLEQIVNTIRAALIASRKVTTQIPGGARAALPLHRAVLDAIHQRQPDEAEHAMLALISRASADIQRIIAISHH
jgi:DNA-binding FadR family transcriptional regulator